MRDFSTKSNFDFSQVISYQKTGLCQKKHLQLLVAIDRAKDHGLITFDVPFRDYSEYYESYKQ